MPISWDDSHATVLLIFETVIASAEKWENISSWPDKTQRELKSMKVIRDFACRNIPSDIPPAFSRDQVETDVQRYFNSLDETGRRDFLTGKRSLFWHTCKCGESMGYKDELYRFVDFYDKVAS